MSGAAARCPEAPTAGDEALTWMAQLTIYVHNYNNKQFFSKSLYIPILHKMGQEPGRCIAWTSAHAEVIRHLAEYVGAVFTVPLEQIWQMSACGLLA